jgi:hypothetical protein
MAEAIPAYNTLHSENAFVEFARKNLIGRWGQNLQKYVLYFETHQVGSRIPLKLF